MGEAAAMGEASGLAQEASDSTRIVGVLVHRLLQRGLAEGAVDDADLLRQAKALLTAADAAEHDDVQAMCRAVVQAFRRLSAHEELRGLYARGIPRYEVPFTLRDGSRIVRGTIDCLVEEPGRVTVVEFKTGRPRPEHMAQAGLYTRAVRAAYPSASVDTRLFYAE